MSRAVLASGLAFILLATACGRASQRSLPPPPPDLTGARVMLVPVLATGAVPTELDAELAFWLAQRAPATDWIPGDELQAAVDRAAAWRLRLSAMPRRVVTDDRRAPYLVDPTYGELRRLGAVVDAHIALLPIAVRRPDPSSPGLELTVAVVDVRGGRVHWIGAVRAGEDAGEGGRPAAELAESLARILFP